MLSQWPHFSYANQPSLLALYGVIPSLMSYIFFLFLLVHRRWRSMKSVQAAKAEQNGRDVRQRGSGHHSLSRLINLRDKNPLRTAKVASHFVTHLQPAFQNRQLKWLTDCLIEVIIPVQFQLLSPFNDWQEALVP